MAKKSILAIDDDPVVLRVLSGLLASSFELRISKSAMEATVLMVECSPDVILLDIEMPDVSGFEFLHTIKKNPKFMNIPVVIVSSHHEEEFASHAEKSGASAVVAKPINKDDLIEKISYALGHPIKNIVENKNGAM